MLALGEEQCAALFSMMHEDEIRDISAAMAQLGAVRSEIVERLCTDFVEHLGCAGSLVGSFESTETPADQDAAARPRRRRSWRKSAAPPAAPCGTSSAT